MSELLYRYFVTGIAQNSKLQEIGNILQLSLEILESTLKIVVNLLFLESTKQK